MKTNRIIDIIDFIFILIAPVHPALIVLAMLQYAMRRWDIFCRGIISLCGIRVITSWMLILLPGLANEQHELAPETQPAAALVPNTSVLSTNQWLAALDENPHLLIYGPSKAGKSTLAQAIVSMFGNCEYVVIDPMPNKPAERKWGGIDFITLDLDGDDEYASIKAALTAIDEEDNRRRRTMREITHRPLIVIVDEVLALVGALGDVTNEHGKKEPRMSHFIRRKGYSARHRNIKIILIGQGKNLIDLGLNSSTARNNYAQIRVFRNPATNERAAYIVSDDGEYALDISQVPQLAASATHRARVWLTQDEIESELLSVSGMPPGSVGSVLAEPGSVGFGLPNAGSGASSVQSNGLNPAETILPGDRTELASLMKALTLYQQTGKETDAIEQAFGVRKGSSKEYARARSLFKTALQEAQH